MGTAKGLTIGIAVGVILAVGVVAALMSGTLTTSIAAVNKITTAPDGRESVRIGGNPLEGQREAVAVYNNCITELLTDKGRSVQTAKVQCWPDGQSWSLLNKPQGVPLAKFTFDAPSQLKDQGVTCFACSSRVLIYGDNGSEYELALKDQVGEKRYPVKPWELPG
jgi:hypothetical protein